MKSIILLISVLSTFLFAQSSVEVHGTSTLHDWKMVSDSAVVQMVEEDNKITSLSVSLVIETLKSGDDGLDENAYEAIKVDQKSSITFNLIEQKADGSLYGTFSIGEKTKNATVVPESIENGVIKGTFKEKMSSFGIEPPSFLFGAMSAGDEIVIKYTISK